MCYRFCLARLIDIKMSSEGYFRIFDLATLKNYIYLHCYLQFHVKLYLIKTGKD